MTRKFDFLIIGSGVAGMSYALKVARAKKGKIAIVCKTTLEEAYGWCLVSGSLEYVVEGGWRPGHTGGSFTHSALYLSLFHLAACTWVVSLMINHQSGE